MNLSLLIAAIISVESGGNNNAVGDHGRAIGPLQIHKEMVDDVNRFAGTSYQWKRMTNRSESISVFTAYVKKYCLKDDPETIARKWNGGPNGHKKPATLKYWNKVKAKL